MYRIGILLFIVCGVMCVATSTGTMAAPCKPSPCKIFCDNSEAALANYDCLKYDVESAKSSLESTDYGGKPMATRAGLWTLYRQRCDRPQLTKPNDCTNANMWKDELDYQVTAAYDKIDNDCGMVPCTSPTAQEYKDALVDAINDIVNARHNQLNEQEDSVNYLNERASCEASSDPEAYPKPGPHPALSW